VGPLLVSIPKGDLLANPPSIANRTSTGMLGFSYGDVLQPSISFDHGTGDEAILAMGDLGYDFAAHSNIVLFAVHNSANPGATVSSPISIPVPPYEIPITPPQPGGVDNLDDGDGRLSASVYRVGDVLYGVHGVQFNNHAAIQWFLVSASTGSPLGS